jgi:SAM-dependent methyltransferase
MHWRGKYLIQRSLSFLPGNLGSSINHGLSVNFGGLKNPKFFAIHNTLAMFSLLRTLGFDLRDRTFVELGTGWTSASAMILLGLSAKEVYSFDLYRHLDQTLVELALKNLTDLRPYTSKTFPFPCNLQEEAALLDMSKLDSSRFHYFAPYDARTTSLESNTIDCYFSQAVLEHAPRPIIEGLLAESFRMLKPGGLCYHYIQPTMHAAWVDSKATGIDYLTCPDWSWRIFYENDIAHECRLRGVDHVALIRSAGFEIIGEWHTVDQKALAALPRKKLAKRFQFYSGEEICTDYIWVVGRKPVDSTGQ